MRVIADRFTDSVIEPECHELVPWMFPFAAALAAMINAVVLLVPSMIAGGVSNVVTDVAVWMFILLATAFLLGDLSTIGFARQARLRLPSAADRLYARLALLTGLLILCIFWASVYEHACRAVHALTLTQAVGAMLMTLGTALRYGAIRTLGRHFATEITVCRDQRLVRAGLYRYVRHPSETGLLAVTLGAVMLLSSWTAAALWIAALVPVVLWRLHLEDRQLDAAFAGTFRSYRREVRRFIPFVI